MDCQEPVLKGSRVRTCGAPAKQFRGPLGLMHWRCEEHTYYPSKKDEE